MSTAAEIFKQAVESLIDLSKALGEDVTTAKEARMQSDTPQTWSGPPLHWWGVKRTRL
jgi:hypothetical protein